MRALLHRLLSEGWFSRALLLLQFYFVYWTLDWSMAYASTALAAVVQNPVAKADVLMGAAANIGAVFVGPQALLMMATSRYMEMRSKTPIMMADRRQADAPPAPAVA
jgi:hypothetical protein